MTENSLQVTPLTPQTGAIISGIDLTQPLSDADQERIHTLWMQHLVIFFRGQDISLEQQKEFGRRFGTLHVHPAAPSPDGHPEILVIHADENSKRIAGEKWHSDVSCDAEPPMGSILHLTEVPSKGGDTLFANMYMAYDALSDKLQNFLSSLTAIHGSEHVYRGRYGKTEQLRDGIYPQSEHPIVRTHPVTGRKALFVNRTFTTSIVGMKPAESAALLNFLTKHVETPEFHCRFRWEANSIACWDNRCTQHLALWDYYPEVRHGTRVTLKGDKPFH